MASFFTNEATSLRPLKHNNINYHTSMQCSILTIQVTIKKSSNTNLQKKHVKLLPKLTADSATYDAFNARITLPN